MAAGHSLAPQVPVRSFVLVLTFIAGAAWGISELQPAADAAPALAARPREIASISFEGRGLPATELRGVMQSKAGAELDDAALAHDRDALEAALVAQGYLAAKVDPAQITFDASGEAFVTLAITQGPLYRVRAVQLTGIPTREAGVVTIETGDIAIADRIEHARAALQARLAARGKKLAIAVELHRDDLAAKVDVELVAHPLTARK